MEARRCSAIAWKRVHDREEQAIAGHIQERYGVAKDEAEHQVKTWVNRM